MKNPEFQDMNRRLQHDILHLEKWVVHSFRAALVGMFITFLLFMVFVVLSLLLVAYLLEAKDVDLSKAIINMIKELFGNSERSALIFKWLKLK